MVVVPILLRQPNLSGHVLKKQVNSTLVAGGTGGALLDLLGTVFRRYVELLSFFGKCCDGVVAAFFYFASSPGGRGL